MNYDPIILMLQPVITKALQNLSNDDVNMNITSVKKITNSIVSDYFKGTKNAKINSALLEINSMFSGRGNAWARVNIDANCKAWSLIECKLANAHLEGHDKYYSQNLLDTFQSAGFCWMRFGGTSKRGALFHLRHKGSKLEESIKIYLSKELVLRSVKNLNGVPHNLKLEEGIFLKQDKKEVEHIPVNKSELQDLGIFSLEDMLGEEDVSEVFS